jgi:hypothetical protein
MSCDNARVWCRKCGDEITYLGPQAVTCLDCRQSSRDADDNQS